MGNPSRPFDDPGEFHFQMDHLNWRNLADPPKNLPLPPPPEMWIRYRTNPLLALGEPTDIIKVLKQIPFIVSISYVMDEVTDYADLVLPEEIEFERYMPYFNIRNACHKKYFMLALAQPVVKVGNTMNIAQMTRAMAVDAKRNLLKASLTLGYCLAPKFIPIMGCSPCEIPHIGISAKASMFRVAPMSARSSPAP